MYFEPIIVHSTVRRLAPGGEEEEGDGLPAGAAGAAPYYPSVPRPDVPPIDYRHQQQQMKKRQQAAGEWFLQ
jgi:hypothetical protein